MRWSIACWAWTRRVIPVAELRVPGPLPHQNVGIFYRVRVTGGQLRPEPNGETAEPAWTPVSGVARLRRSSLVDVGLALAAVPSGSRPCRSRSGWRPYPALRPRPPGPRAIMDSVPQTPDPQTRNAVTSRIVAYVTAGWPASASPKSATAAATPTSPRNSPATARCHRHPRTGHRRDLHPLRPHQSREVTEHPSPQPKTAKVE